jgi:hypothetical protein
MSQMIRAHAVADATTTLAPAARIAALAARVRRPGPFVTAQRAFADLQQRHGELRETLRSRIAELHAAGGEGANTSGSLIRAIRECDAELTACSDACREALGRLVEARQPFGVAIAAALAPERTAAARRALQAAMELVDELDLLDQIGREIGSSGGSPAPHPLPQFRGSLSPLVDRLRRLALE